MTPPQAAARSAASVRAARANAPRVGAKPPLRVLDERPRRRGRLLRALAVAVIAGSLLAVVVAHSMLAQGQVRLTAAQAEMAAEQAVHRQLLASVAEAEDPATIVAEAKKLNLVPPASVTQLPAVSLGTPIGAATSPAPAPSSPTSTSASSTTTGRSASR